MPRSLPFRPIATLLALALLLVLPAAIVPRPAAAQLPSADLAILRLTGPHAVAPGRMVTFRVEAVNFGPDTSELWVRLSYSADLQLVAMRCDRGVSPDTPDCEYSNVAPGERVTTLVTFRMAIGAGSPETVTACTGDEGDIATDPNPGNDCMIRTVAIVGG